MPTIPRRPAQTIYQLHIIITALRQASHRPKRKGDYDNDNRRGQCGATTTVKATTKASRNTATKQQQQQKQQQQKQKQKQKQEQQQRQ